MESESPSAYLDALPKVQPETNCHLKSLHSSTKGLVGASFFLALNLSSHGGADVCRLPSRVPSPFCICDRVQEKGRHPPFFHLMLEQREFAWLRLHELPHPHVDLIITRIYTKHSARLNRE